MRLEQPRTPKEIPFPKINIPDLSPVNFDAEGYNRVTKIETDINLNGKQLRGIITFERTNQDSYPVEIAIESFDPDLDEYEGRMSSFKAVLNNDKNSTFGYETSDKKFHPHWQIHTRRVNESLRHQGFGKWNMQLLEKLIRQVSDKYPFLHADWIELETRLGSISNLVTKPELGYIPHPNDIEAAKKLLAQTTEELDESNRDPAVTFIKIINPNFSIDQFNVNKNPFSY